MRFSFLFTLCFLLSNLTYGQTTSTQIYLCELFETEGKLSLTPPLNISNQSGYNNQPYFESDHLILYAGTRNGQTDIVQYNIDLGLENWITDTPGSEYSPQPIPNINNIAAVRLETNGEQFLAAYSTTNNLSSKLITTPIVGYYRWISQNELISAILVDEGLSLAKHNLKKGTLDTLDTNIGRSLHLNPTSKENNSVQSEITYISKKNSQSQIVSISLDGKNKSVICNTLSGSEDFCWDSKGNIVMGQGSSILYYNPERKKTWTVIEDMSKFKLKNITRIAISPSGQYLVFVAESEIN